MSVSLKIPAYLSNFLTLDNGRTIAKLKVFYIGETEDGRRFGEEFSKKLAETLPYCPVVAYYSDIKDDFIGHNSTQYIYGLVQPSAEYSFEEDEDGKVWLITEVMLYTDREDNIGKIAEKIVGHSQSLELDRKTVKYNIFNENGKTKIEFTEGSLIGLSVLGLNQKPAFTGSEFFMATDFSELRSKFENFFSCLEENSRGEQMEKEKFEEFANFIRLSYTEKMTKAEKKLREELGDYCIYVVSMDDNIIVAQRYEETGANYYKYDYTLNETELSISNERKAYVNYLTRDEMDYLEGYSNQPEITYTEQQATVEDTAVNAEENEEFKKEEEKESCSSCEPEKEKEKCEEDKEDIESCKSCEPKKEKCEEDKEEDDDDNSSEDIDDDDDDKKVKCSELSNSEGNEGEGDGGNEELPKEDSAQENEAECALHDPAALSDSERIELENYRRKEKVELIKSFEDVIDNEVLNEFVSKVDEYDYAKLEAELSIIHSKANRNGKIATTQPAVKPMSFNNYNGKSNAQNESYKDLVARILNK